MCFWVYHMRAFCVFQFWQFLIIVALLILHNTNASIGYSFSSNFSLSYNERPPRTLMVSQWDLYAFFEYTRGESHQMSFDSSTYHLIESFRVLPTVLISILPSLCTNSFRIHCVFWQQIVQHTLTSSGLRDFNKIKYRSYVCHSY